MFERWFLVSAILLACIALNQGMHRRKTSYPDLQMSPKSFIKARDSSLPDKDGVYFYQVDARNETFISEDYGLTFKRFKNGKFVADFTLISRTSDELRYELIIKQTDRELYVKLGYFGYLSGSAIDNINTFEGNSHWASFGFGKDFNTPIGNSVFKFETERNEKFISFDYGASWAYIDWDNIIGDTLRLVRFNTSDDGFQVILKNTQFDSYYRIGPTEIWFSSTLNDFSLNWPTTGRWTLLGNNPNDN